MIRTELKIKLDKLEIPESWYSLYGERTIDSTYILEWSFQWNIHFFERGTDEKIASFNTEEEACDYFYEMLKKTKSVMDRAEEERGNNIISPAVEDKRLFIASEDGDVNAIEVPLS